MTRARDLANFVSNAQGDVRFDTDTLFIDSSANRVGIGTATPAHPLDVDGEVRFNSNIRLTEATSSSETGSINLADSGLMQVQAFGTGGEIAFDTGSSATERFRICDTGYLQADSASQVRFTLGSEGTAGSNTANWIRGHGTTLGFNSSSGDYTFEVGGAERMRMLAAGGITFNGDTAAANALDDYEEGHHTAVIYGDGTGTGSPLPIRSSHDQLAYTKIGRVVHIQGKLETLGSHSATGNLRIVLPFAVAALNDVAGMAAGTAVFYRTGDGIHYNSFIASAMNSTNAIFYQNTTNGDLSTLNAANMDSAIEMFIGLTYISSA